MKEESQGQRMDHSVTGCSMISHSNSPKSTRIISVAATHCERENERERMRERGKRKREIKKGGRGEL